MLADDVAVHLAREVGARPAGSAAERRALRYVEGRFRSAGLRVGRDRFATPRGRSGNVVGVWDAEGRCLYVLMAHVDTVVGSPGGSDNASGVGVVAALAPRLRALRPRCDVWLVGTGAEERRWTGSPDHLGALALVRRLRRLGRARDVRAALSVDMLGEQRRFWLRSPRRAPGRTERETLAAARAERVAVRWVRDSASGNSDHRELAMAGLPGAVLQAWGGTTRCYHQACDTWRRVDPQTLARARRIAERILRKAAP